MKTLAVLPRPPLSTTYRPGWRASSSGRVVGPACSMVARSIKATSAMTSLMRVGTRVAVTITTGESAASVATAAMAGASGTNSAARAAAMGRDDMTTP